MPDCPQHSSMQFLIPLYAAKRKCNISRLTIHHSPFTILLSYSQGPSKLFSLQNNFHYKQGREQRL